MKKSIFIISFIFLLASCATTHMSKTDKAPDLTFPARQSDTSNYSRNFLLAVVSFSGTT